MRDKDSIILEHAYLQILEEGRKKRYMEMFKNFPEDGIRNADMHIDWAIENLKREDRILWYLRQVKAVIWMTYNKKFLDGYVQALRENDPGSKEFDRNTKLNPNDYLEKMPDWVRKSGIFARALGIAMGHTSKNYNALLESISQSLSHYFSLGIPEIDNFRFENQEWDEVLRIFRKHEEEWKQKQVQWIDITDELQNGEITPLITFPDDFVWFNLNRSYCRKEGSAMGHCGNAASRSGTVLSLRKIKKERNKVLSRPSLTFILEDDGALGEMKGRANTKPKEMYHPYILKLLTHKVGNDYLVKSIRGGGYAPKNNFALSDLNDERERELYKIRPEFTPIQFLYKEMGPSPEFQKILKQKIDNKNMDEGEMEYVIQNGLADIETSIKLAVSYLIEERSDFDEAAEFFGNIDYLKHLPLILKSFDSSKNFVLENNKIYFDYPLDQTDLFDKIESFAGKEFEQYLPYYKGDEYFEFWGTETYSQDVARMLNQLKKRDINLYNRLNDYMVKEYKEVKGVDPADDGLELTNIIMEEIDHDVYQAFKWANDSGHEAGTHAALIKSFDDYIKDLPFITERRETQNGLQRLAVAIDLGTFHDILKDPTSLDEFWRGESIYYILNEMDSYEKYSAPYYGFEGYDEEAAIERLIDQLSEMNFL